MFVKASEFGLNVIFKKTPQEQNRIKKFIVMEFPLEFLKFLFHFTLSIFLEEYFLSKKNHQRHLSYIPVMVPSNGKL